MALTPEKTPELKQRGSSPPAVVGHPSQSGFNKHVHEECNPPTLCFTLSSVGLSVFPPAENSPGFPAHHIVLLLCSLYCFFLQSDALLYLLLLQLKQSHPSSQSLELRTLWTGSKLCSFGEGERKRARGFFLCLDCVFCFVLFICSP